MFVITFFLFVLCNSALGFKSDPLYKAYLSWQTRHKKMLYTTQVEAEAEAGTRFANWKTSYEIVKKNNEEIKSGKAKGALFALNKFADMSAQEFREKYLSTVEATPEPQREYLPKTTVAAPAVWDWAQRGKTTKVKDQGQCGSCWAFSATENIESVWMIKHGLTNDTMKPLSPQQIVDCDNVDGGCNGGDTPTAYKYVMSAGGLETDRDYPYRAVDEHCRFDKSKIYAHITGWKYATRQHDEKTLIDNVATVSPVSICVDASRWQYYDSGVMTAAQCSTHVELDHCVQITGYDLSSSTPYWLVRNSWSESWGERGFIRLAYGHNTCGVTDEATTATI